MKITEMLFREYNVEGVKIIDARACPPATCTWNGKKLLTGADLMQQIIRGKEYISRLEVAIKNMEDILNDASKIAVDENTTKKYKIYNKHSKMLIDVIHAKTPEEAVKKICGMIFPLDLTQDRLKNVMQKLDIVESISNEILEVIEEEKLDVVAEETDACNGLLSRD